jgi:3-oxoacyl-[acyl-carrier-protein] synthase II
MMFAMDTAHQALMDANWMPTDLDKRSRTGVCMGSGIGSTEEIANAVAILEKEVRYD